MRLMRQNTLQLLIPLPMSIQRLNVINPILRRPGLPLLHGRLRHAHTLHPRK
ncbi:hypothetical protein K443DRAFT_655214 [Laccaria amethystina LaAM-08-1]|uniref:Uncharacterized protein n=1 Tax=Laccaria amethystina LaAM-08-1 TaxID=1095629 RepID=A0A0C9WSY2_9AGAR|nr:hypothetical protein K443DRAFT_655214 [Laccaria amethystina LaAM-08-1]